LQLPNIIPYYPTSLLDSVHSKSNSASFDSLPNQPKEGHLRQKMLLVTNLIQEMTGLIPSNCVDPINFQLLLRLESKMDSKGLSGKHYHGYRHSII
jgi:hypothetical protein